MKEKRERRLDGEFQKYIYDILKNKVKDVELTEMFTITEVNVTADLKHAKVFVSVFSADEEKKNKTFQAILRSASFVRREISKIMHIRTVPELHFTIDTSEEYGNKIDTILSTITYSDDGNTEV